MSNSIQNAINLKTRLLYLHQQDNFADSVVKAKLRQYLLHVYLIGCNPLIKLDNNKTVITKEEISLTFNSETAKESYFAYCESK